MNRFLIIPLTLFMTACTTGQLYGTRQLGCDVEFQAIPTYQADPFSVFFTKEI